MMQEQPSKSLRLSTILSHEEMLELEAQVYVAMTEIDYDLREWRKLYAKMEA